MQPTHETKNPKVSHENRVTYLSRLHPVQTVSVCDGDLGSAHCTVQCRGDPVEYGPPQVNPAYKLKVVGAAWAVGNNVENGLI